jgi:caffeoyl-CoA O-methyltransferase
VVELGTFTGMSSLWMARALPDDGRLLCLDVSEEWTAVARSYWERAGVADRVELRLGPALDTLRSLPPEPQFDLAFIDADKRSYPDYLTELVPRLVPGGVLLADNVLWSGKISDDPGESAEALRRFNRLVADHPDLEAVVLAFADGLTLARKRG